MLRSSCILSKFYIKPQLLPLFVALLVCCILSKFYIKPQPITPDYLSYKGCILSKFYIKPQPSTPTCDSRSSCILSKFYIKPQHMDASKGVVYVVSYRNSTSNHNRAPGSGFWSAGCILSKFYIKPQPILKSNITTKGCILSKFYIKPQLCLTLILIQMVVSYRNSTSNHNRHDGNRFGYWVVSYRNSTSNHNSAGGQVASGLVVSYRNSTSNHNSGGSFDFSTPVVSYRNSTSNHNIFLSLGVVFVLYLIEILHQTTTLAVPLSFVVGCILSKFYIKPQLAENVKIVCVVVSYRNSTSNHNVRAIREVQAELYLIEILHQTTTSNRPQ